MTISRLDLRGTYIPGQKQIYTNIVNVFGWKVIQHIMPADSKLVMVSKNTVIREHAPNITLYVRGRGTVINSVVGTIDDRVPGLYTPERPDHPEGVTTVTAVEELEFWCFNWTLNRGKLPITQPIRLNTAETITIPANKYVLICYGDLGGYTVGQSFTTDGSTLTAMSKTYGFILETKYE